VTVKIHRSFRRNVGEKLLQISRLAFTLTFLLAMMTPVWRNGLFAKLPVSRFHVSGQSFPVGALAIVPVIAGCTWLVGRLLERPRRPLRLGSTYIALPVLGFGTLVLARTWPVHVQHTAIVTTVAVILFWSAYLYGLLEWPSTWALASIALLLALQGTIGVAQFARQDSVGLSWIGEAALHPQGQGVSVIQVAGRRWLRAYGLTPHPNALGGYLSMSLLVCLGALDSAKAKWRHWLGLCLVLGSLGLLFTFSRSAWLGTFAGLAYMASIVRPWQYLSGRPRRARGMTLVLGVFLILAAIAFLSIFGSLLATRLFDLNDPLERRSLQDRVHDIRQAWGLIRTVPLRGTGSGYYLAALWAHVGEDRPPGIRTVHNVPLLAAAELGVFGAVLWIWLLLAAPIALARQTSRSPQEMMEGRAARAGGAAALVSALIVSMFDSYLYIASVWWAALYLGALIGQWAQGRTSRRPNGEQP
jgi:hypothetical protein